MTERRKIPIAKEKKCPKCDSTTVQYEGPRGPEIIGKRKSTTKRYNYTCEKGHHFISFKPPS